MTTRRGFLVGAAAAAAPRLSWAAVGAPDYLAAARRADGAYELHGLTLDGDSVFTIPLPGRGHAATARPDRAEAVAFARRPGTYALVLDCASGGVSARLSSPEGRVFSGHGAYSADGALLVTAENVYAEGRGALGLWDAANGYQRIGEVPSGGVGPHEIIHLSTGGYAVANGGILTHPATGREKLNLATMRPNLSLFDEVLNLAASRELTHDLHRLSIRHLAEGPDGAVVFAAQWEGDAFDTPPLLGRLSGRALRLIDGPAHLPVRMRGYAGSVAVSGDGERIAITSPRGGMAPVFGATGDYLNAINADDICGVAPAPDGFLATTGGGWILRISGDEISARTRHPVAWDNHLIALGVLNRGSA